MISITPQGDIYLCKTPLENDYKNQLTFTNATSQLTYFNSKIEKTLDNYTYIKKDNIIKVGYPIDEIIDCNYMFYKNTGFTNKYYFCFITNMEYINENCTSISFETDVFQTYQFNIQYKPCFVEREHVNSDNVGEHTIPEGLDTGEFIIDNKIKRTGLGKDNICFILATTVYPYITYSTLNSQWELDGGVSTPCNVYNSNLSGLEYFFYTNTTLGIEKLQHTIEAYANSGRSDAIYMLFTCPDCCFEKVLEEPTDTTYYGYWGSVKQKQGACSTNWHNNTTAYIYKPTTLNGYTPRNKKLLTYPYCYLLMNNGNGGNAIYKYELFRDDPNVDYCDFTLSSAICPGANIVLKPYRYKNNDASFNYMDSLPLGKFPMCSWNSDAYVNWLVQNNSNVTFGLIEQGLGIAGNISSANFGGVISSGVGFIGSIMSLRDKRETATPQANGNTNSGDVTYALEETTFTAYQMSVKQEYAEIIDKYFDMFGYKVNKVKVPNIIGRSKWNYVKTVDCNFEGDIPQQFLQIIKQMFNNGITLWHDPQYMYDYTQTNNIVS